MEGTSRVQMFLNCNLGCLEKTHIHTWGHWDRRCSRIFGLVGKVSSNMEDMLNVIDKTSKSVNSIWNIDWLSAIWEKTKYSTTRLHLFHFLQLPKSLFGLCDLTISMDADCLLPWKSVLPWSGPEISHAPTQPYTDTLYISIEIISYLSMDVKV